MQGQKGSLSHEGLQKFDTFNFIFLGIQLERFILTLLNESEHHILPRLCFSPFLLLFRISHFDGLSFQNHGNDSRSFYGSKRGYLFFFGFLVNMCVCVCMHTLTHTWRVWSWHLNLVS